MKQASKSCLIFIAKKYNIAQSDKLISLLFDTHVYFFRHLTAAALQLKQKERHEQNLLSTMYSLSRHILCQQMEEALGTNKMMPREFQLHI